VQNTIRILCPHLALVDRIGKCEAPDKPTVRPFDTMVLFALFFLFLFPLTLNGEDRIFDRDLHIFFLDLGKLSLNGILAFGFADVDGRSPVGNGHDFLPLSGSRAG